MDTPQPDASDASQPENKNNFLNVPQMQVPPVLNLDNSN